MPVPKRINPIEKRTTLRDEAYTALKSGILDGTFVPGERLDDHALQQWLGISRTPIREAIVLLDSEGLVDTKAQRYTRIAEPDPALAHDELLAIGALMSGVMRQAVPALNDRGAAELQSRIEAVERHARDEGRDETLGAIQRLHESTLYWCPNEPLVSVVAEALTLHGFHLRTTIADEKLQWPELLRSCERLRTAIQRRDAVAAELVTAWMHFVPGNPERPADSATDRVG